MPVLLHLSTAFVLAVSPCEECLVPKRLTSHPSAAPGPLIVGPVSDKSEYWFHGEIFSTTILN